MSARAKEFLDEFIQGRAAVGERGGAQTASEAVTEAEAQGIPEQELLEEAGSDLQGYIDQGLYTPAHDEDDKAGDDL